MLSRHPFSGWPRRHSVLKGASRGQTQNADQVQADMALMVQRASLGQDFRGREPYSHRTGSSADAPGPLCELLVARGWQDTAAEPPHSVEALKKWWLQAGCAQTGYGWPGTVQGASVPDLGWWHIKLVKTS